MKATLGLLGLLPPALAQTWRGVTTITVTETASCAPSSTSSAATQLPTIWLAGDSTMAPGGGHNGTEGWGQYLQYSFGTKLAGTMQAFVNNSAYAGRSMRSFTREGRFDRIAAVVKPGDWVVIEMGHNDGGSPYPASSDNGRGDCPGAGNETCPTVYANMTETVLTYPAYQIQAAKTFLALGAKIILSSPTPNNAWETGNFSYSTDRFTYYSMLSTQLLGGPEAGVWFVQHGQYAAQAERLLGPSIVTENYPMDHTHTMPYLADVYSQAFVLALKCGSSPLADLIVNATSRIEGPILGSCILANSTTPV